MTNDSYDWFSADSATFGDRLAAARDAAGMSQADLARRLGVKASTLRGWEEDQSEPRANRLSMLSGLLGVSLPWLLTGEGEGVEPPSEASELSGDVSAILAELRDLRADLDAKVGRLAILEKRLRAKLKEEA
ncbi:helix-turn-helix domain-containing protein [Pseudooceanicola onchidii]|uniref:helix-turn-helix domain-containing protein n=1 Tax=Pseudooceanicola onchidii TaxID=2562279 RepID=UPI0010A9B218|nr:helix-turn-helix domain-containing protein [Pseudooceanicola onchidii]